MYAFFPSRACVTILTTKYQMFQLKSPNLQFECDEYCDWCTANETKHTKYQSNTDLWNNPKINPPQTVYVKPPTFTLIKSNKQTKNQIDQHQSIKLKLQYKSTKTNKT